MTRPKISILLPTRGRPEIAARFLESVAATASRPELLDVVVYVDVDDLASHGIASDKVCITRIVGPKISMGACTMACLAASHGEIIVLANDDLVLRTRAWDDRLAALHASSPDQIYLAYPNDLFKGAGACTFPIISRVLCDLLVEPFPRNYRGAFIDTHLMDIFRRLRHAGVDRIHYLADVVFEHLHYRTGKSAFDATYAARQRFADDATFVALAGARRSAAALLLAKVRQAPAPRASGAVPSDIVWPEGVLAAVFMFFRVFMLDRGLPIKVRVYFWIWFVGRYMAARGMLRPFLG